ncbi:MAG: ATP-dependent sacrificial sulfur transferase LarE [Coriobacteriia bacterium]|nr:ATP-dependent sacrificial sulfur transferase LarE [Coriobacteriia bacterium]
MLLERLSSLRSVLVAYSGGVDSTLLAVAAHAVMGSSCLAVLALSDTYPPSEADSARSTAAALGLRVMEVETNELADPRFRANGPDRCYHCKSELFGLLKTVAEVRGLEHVADGSNADDDADHRPGARAAAELDILTPLRDVGMTKAHVRDVARMLDLPNWDKPSMACLASRFPYGCEITSEDLERVMLAEDGLRALGLRQSRVRAHGEVARVEVGADEMQRAWESRAQVLEAVRAGGFPYVALDLEGYRSGSMNDVLAPEERKTAREGA